jgi:hypothetical protein
MAGNVNLTNSAYNNLNGRLTAPALSGMVEHLRAFGRERDPRILECNQKSRKSDKGLLRG